MYSLSLICFISNFLSVSIGDVLSIELFIALVVLEVLDTLEVLVILDVLDVLSLAIEFDVFKVFDKSKSDIS